MLKTVTVDDVMGWEPCWDRDEVEDAAGGREALTPLEIADLKIQAHERLWVLLRPEIIERKRLHELACVFAECVLLRERGMGQEPDTRSWAAIETKRRWLRGEATDEQLAAAQAAASDAAEATDEQLAAALAAAWAAARDARDAAEAAARAAWAAAWAASDAAWDAEIEWQLEQVRLVLRDQAEGRW